MSQAQSQSRSPAGAERRRFPRFPAKQKLLAHLVEADRPAAVRDVGFGGFAIETREPVTVGQTVTVRFTSPDDRTMTLTAAPLHSWPSCDEAGAPCYVTGFAFADDAPRREIEQLIDVVTAPGLFRAVEES